MNQKVKELKEEMDKLTRISIILSVPLEQVEKSVKTENIIKQLDQIESHRTLHSKIRIQMHREHLPGWTTFWPITQGSINFKEWKSHKEYP